MQPEDMFVMDAEKREYLRKPKVCSTPAFLSFCEHFYRLDDSIHLAPSSMFLPRLKTLTSPSNRRLARHSFLRHSIEVPGAAFIRTHSGRCLSRCSSNANSVQTHASKSRKLNRSRAFRKAKESLETWDIMTGCGYPSLRIPRST